MTVLTLCHAAGLDTGYLCDSMGWSIIGFALGIVVGILIRPFIFRSKR